MEQSKQKFEDSVATPTEFGRSDAVKASPGAKSKRKRKATKAKAVEVPIDPAAFDYDAMGIAPEDVPIFEEVRDLFISLGRRSAAEVFECGSALSRIEEKLPDQKSFEAWTRKACGVTRRGAWNYVSVHRRLLEHRDRLVAQRVPASAMYKLCAADEDTVESVLASFESGTRLTVKQIGVLVKGDEGPTLQDIAERGGVAGLKAKIAKKSSIGVPELMANAVEILAIILVALEPHRNGKGVQKAGLQRKLVHLARLLRQQIEWLTWVATPEGPDTQIHAHGQPLTRDDRWHDAWYAINLLGGYESWPKSPDLGPWFADKIVPDLEWLLGDQAAKAHRIAEKKIKDGAAAATAAAKASRKQGKRNVDPDEAVNDRIASRQELTAANAPSSKAQ